MPRHVEILSNVKIGALHFYFALGALNSVASPRDMSCLYLHLIGQN